MHSIIQTFVSMKKFLLNPNDPNAFTSEVMHKVVLNGIDFELPEHIWDAIDDAFGYYWNVEVGYGGWPDFNSAVNSISNWLHQEHIIFGFNKIVTIVDIMFNWIEQVPGAILDDSEVVIPRSFEQEEKERQLLKKKVDIVEQLEEEQVQDLPNSNTSNLPIPNFHDAWTNYVFISDKLKEFYPSTYLRLTNLFNEMKIEWGEVKNTKDIWIRDYMPIQIDYKRFLVYNYDPDYLKDTGKKLLTDSHTIFKGVIDHFHWKNIEITLDGGNVVACNNYRILTDKVFRENGKEPYDPNFCHLLQDALCSKIIFLPWKCDNSKEANADVYGHADGIVKWTENDKILMSNLREFHPENADKIRRRLEKAGFHVTEMLFNVPNLNKEFNWAYINYLQVGNKIIVPTFGIPEDLEALKYIREANPFCTVKGFRMRDIARNGGALHCITWNIKK